MLLWDPKSARLHMSSVLPWLLGSVYFYLFFLMCLAKAVLSISDACPEYTKVTRSTPTFSRKLMFEARLSIWAEVTLELTGAPS